MPGALASPISVPAWAALGAALAVARLLHSYLRLRAVRGHKQVFVLAVSLEFESEAERDAWVEIWRPLAAHVARAEPDTLAFELAIADPRRALVFERYVDKHAFVEIHRRSEPYLAYKAATAALERPPRVSGQSYFETNVGFFR